MKGLVSSVAAVLAVTAIASCSSDSTAESVPTTGAETTTTTTSTTVAPTTTIDPVVADQTAYFFLSSEVNDVIAKVGRVTSREECETMALANAKFVTGVEEHQWRSEVQEEVNELIRVIVLRKAMYERCVRTGTGVLFFDQEAGEAATLLRYALGLSTDRGE